MKILPHDYKEKYKCINSSGSTALIYADEYLEYAYKIYYSKFKYNEEKIEEFLKLNNPNCLSPKDIISLDSNPEELVGYEMIFDSGIALNRLRGISLTELISASKDIAPTLQDISSHHFLIVDPNVENIIFSDTYKFVDTYSFGLFKQFSEDKIYLKNLLKVNQVVLNGLIGIYYREFLTKYLEQNPKYKRIIQSLKTIDANYIYIILSLIQDSLQEDDLELVQSKVYSLMKK